MKKLSKVYRTHMIETHALRGFDIEVAEASFVTVTGPSGSGKTPSQYRRTPGKTSSDGRYLLDGVAVKGMSDDAARAA